MGDICGIFTLSFPSRCYPTRGCR